MLTSKCSYIASTTLSVYLAHINKDSSRFTGRAQFLEVVARPGQYVSKYHHSQYYITNNDTIFLKYQILCG